MCKDNINISIVTHMVEESFKRLGRGFLKANLIKVSPFQAGKNTTNTDKVSTTFHRNQRAMEKLTFNIGLGRRSNREQTL